MWINENPIEIRLTPRFQKDIKILAKRYRSIRQDLQPLLQTLQTGQTPGDRIQGFNFPVFKVRLKNSDLKKGKSDGYRVIYYLQTQTAIVLITLYSKTDITDITDRAIAEAISQLDF